MYTHALQPNYVKGNGVDPPLGPEPECN